MDVLAHDKNKEAGSGTSRRRRKDFNGCVVNIFYFFMYKVQTFIHTRNIKYRNTCGKLIDLVKLEEGTGNGTNIIIPKQSNLDYNRLTTLQI